MLRTEDMPTSLREAMRDSAPRRRPRRPPPEEPEAPRRFTDEEAARVALDLDARGPPKPQTGAQRIRISDVLRAAK